MPLPEQDASGPLEGIRVLALENFVAGPLASMLLADWGADVVKVEPAGGDTYRTFPPVQQDERGSSSFSFVRLNRGKRSVVLELASDEGKATFLELVRSADVVLQNLRPGTLTKLGIDYPVLAEVNPKIILVSISGFGQSDVLPGPYTTMPAFDLIGQAMAGLAYATGREGEAPAPIGLPLIDTTTADWAATATLMALFQRERTGRGQHLDVAMYDVGVHLNEYAIGAYGWSGRPPLRGRMPTSAPFEIVPASDGHFAIAVSGQPIWVRFCAAIGRPELAEEPRFANGTLRSAAMETELLRLIEEWASNRTVSDILTLLAEFGVPASRVQGVADLFECPQVEARDMIVRVPDPLLGEVATAGNPIKGVAHGRDLARPAPQLGADTDAVFAEWLAGSSTERMGAS